MRKSPHAEPHDLWLIEEYLVMAQGWLTTRSRVSAPKVEVQPDLPQFDTRIQG
jgi:hypothetical protein